MANGKSDKELEQTAMNLCQTMGVDFGQTWQRFQNGVWNPGGIPVYNRR